MQKKKKTLIAILSLQDKWNISRIMATQSPTYGSFGVHNLSGNRNKWEKASICRKIPLPTNRVGYRSPAGGAWSAWVLSWFFSWYAPRKPNTQPSEGVRTLWLARLHNEGLYRSTAGTTKARLHLTLQARKLITVPIHDICTYCHEG